MSGTTPNPTPSTDTAAPAAQPAPSQPVPAASAPSLLGAEPSTAGGGPQMPEGFEGGADAWGKLDDAGKTAANTAATEKQGAARLEAWTKAEGKPAKIAAWQALNKDQRTEAFKAMTDEQKKELGISDPARPVYGDFKLPEGMALDEAGMKTAAELFAESGLSQEQAQKFIDMATAREIAAAQKFVQDFSNLQTKWHGEIMADPEIGGPKWEADSKPAVDRLIDRLNIPGLREAFNLTGAGNNPPIVKAFVRLGHMVSEDRTKNGAEAPSGGKRSAAEIIYGTPPGNAS